MGTLNALYLRTKGAAIESAVRDLFPGAKVEPGPEFTGFTLANDDFEPPVDELAELSAVFGTDVIWLSFQSVVDAFQFHHWREGTALRSLVYGCHGDEERMWTQADGQAEPWEQAAFFDPESLKFQLEYPENDEQKKELQRIWEKSELLPGRLDPFIDARESARAAAKHYNLPGWGLETANVLSARVASDDGKLPPLEKTAAPSTAKPATQPMSLGIRLLLAFLLGCVLLGLKLLIFGTK